MKYILLLLVLLKQLSATETPSFMPTVSPTGPPVPTMPTMPTKRPTKDPGYALPPHMQYDPIL